MFKIENKFVFQKKKGNFVIDAKGEMQGKSESSFSEFCPGRY